jgi:RNA polymerase sigma-70 factor (ECF subfamily)
MTVTAVPNCFKLLLMGFSLPDEIVARFNRGDPEAFTGIFEELYPVIYLFVARLAHFIPAAQDITTDAFIRLWECRGHFERQTSIKSFLFQTAKNLARDQLRRNLIEKKKLREIQKMGQDLLAGDAQPGEIHAELLDRITREAEHLPNQCRQIFRLSYTNGLSNPEIANRLNISVKTVSNQKNIAIKILKHG